MVNMSVPFIRPDNATRTLWNEVLAAWPTQAANLGFVTGYKAVDNFSGHNADSNGITHAVDIGVDVGNGRGVTPATGQAMAEYLRRLGAQTSRFSYLIHARRIAGQFSNWAWRPYTGSSPHLEHIHLSICDMYWGDPAPVAAEIYDSTSAWGVASMNPAEIQPSGTNITPASPEEDEMTPAQMLEIKQFVQQSVNDNTDRAVNDFRAQISVAASEIVKAIEAGVWANKVFTQATTNDNTDRAVNDFRAQIQNALNKIVASE